MSEPLERGNVPENAKHQHQPAQPGKPVEGHGKYQTDYSDYHDQYKPVCSPEHPAIKSSDTYSLCLRAKVG
jgi:hypothetical protein